MLLKDLYQLTISPQSLEKCVQNSCFPLWWQTQTLLKSPDWRLYVIQFMMCTSPQQIRVLISHSVTTELRRSALPSNTPKSVSLPKCLFISFPLRFLWQQSSTVNSFEHKLWLKTHLAWHLFTPSFVCSWFSLNDSRQNFGLIYIF